MYCLSLKPLVEPHSNESLLASIGSHFETKQVQCLIFQLYLPSAPWRIEARVPAFDLTSTTRLTFDLLSQSFLHFVQLRVNVER